MPTPAERRALLFVAALAALGVSVRGYRAWKPSAGDQAADAGALSRQIAAVAAAVDAATRAGARDGAVPGRKRANRRPASGGPVVRGSAESAVDDSSSRRSAAARAGRGTAPPADPLALYEARRLAVERSNAEARARLDERAADIAAPGPAARGSVRAPARAPHDDRAAADAVAPTSLIDLDTANEAAIATLPRIGPALAARIVADRTARGPFGSLAALQRVRGVGPALAARIGSFVTFSRAGSEWSGVTRAQAAHEKRRRP